MEKSNFTGKDALEQLLDDDDDDFFSGPKSERQEVEDHCAYH